MRRAGLWIVKLIALATAAPALAAGNQASALAVSATVVRIARVPLEAASSPRTLPRLEVAGVPLPETAERSVPPLIVLAEGIPSPAIVMGQSPRRALPTAGRR